MARYFKIVEIDEETYIDETGDCLDGWSQSVIPCQDAVYVAVDDETEEEFNVDLDSFSSI